MNSNQIKSNQNLPLQGASSAPQLRRRPTKPSLNNTQTSSRRSARVNPLVHTPDPSSQDGSEFEKIHVESHIETEASDAEAEAEPPPARTKKNISNTIRNARSNAKSQAKPTPQVRTRRLASAAQPSPNKGSGNKKQKRKARAEPSQSLPQRKTRHRNVYSPSAMP